MNCQLNKEDILELAANHFSCPVSSLKIKIINYTIDEEGVVNEVVTLIPYKDNVVNFALSSCLRRVQVYATLAGSDVIRDLEGTDDFPRDGYLFDQLACRQTIVGWRFGFVIYYQIEKVC